MYFIPMRQRDWREPIAQQRCHDQDRQALIRGRWNNAQGRGHRFALEGGRCRRCRRFVLEGGSGRAPRCAKEGGPRHRHRRFGQPLAP